MTTQSYCNRSNIVSIIGEPSLIAAVDDNANGMIDGNETVFITDAINRAASEMNHALGNQYSPLSSLSGNEWCKWCNAYIAAFYLQSRRGNSPAASVVASVEQYRAQLEEIRWGRDNVPEAEPTHNHGPSVSNFDVQMRNPDGPIAVDVDQSTGGNPGSGVKRNIALINNNY